MKEVNEQTTKTNEQPQNIQRVDKRPSSIYSLVIFVLIFVIGYLFYPQLSMLIPLPGEKLTVSTDYQAVSVTQMLDAENIVLAMATDKGKTETFISAENEPIVLRPVTFKTERVLKGEAKSEFMLGQYGGNGLFDDGSGRKRKFTVTFTNAAEYEKGETYLLFIDKNGEIINGKAGALKMAEDGTFTDISGVKFTLEDMIAYIAGEQTN